MSGGNKKSSFKYVFIPCDANEPIQELTLEFKLTEAIECLTQKLQKHFQQAEGSKTNGIFRYFIFILPCISYFSFIYHLLMSF